MKPMNNSVRCEEARKVKAEDDPHSCDYSYIVAPELKWAQLFDEYLCQHAGTLEVLLSCSYGAPPSIDENAIMTPKRMGSSGGSSLSPSPKYQERYPPRSRPHRQCAQPPSTKRPCVLTNVEQDHHLASGSLRMPTKIPSALRTTATSEVHCFTVFCCCYYFVVLCCCVVLCCSYLVVCEPQLLEQQGESLSADGCGAFLNRLCGFPLFLSGIIFHRLARPNTSPQSPPSVPSAMLFKYPCSSCFCCHPPIK